MEILFEKTALKNSLTSKLLTAVKKQKVIPPSILHENKTGGYELGEAGWHHSLFSDLALIFFACLSLMRHPRAHIFFHGSDLRVIPTKCKPGRG